MSEDEQAVFISYAWGDEGDEIVNQIDQALQKRGVKITRDKRDLDYRGSIREFMERIGQGNCVIVVISDKYLHSPNCMYELIEIAGNKQFQDRVFPIVLQDADICNPVRRIQYIKYWEEKRAELAEAIKTLDPANLQGIREDVKTVSGNVVYAGSIKTGGRYQLKTHSGDVRMTIPADSAFDFEANTFSGDIDSDFEIKVVGKVSQKEIRGTVGKGGATITLKSFSGNVDLKKK